MGLRPRNGFDGMPQPQETSREELNLTKYDERYILPTDGRAFAPQSDNAGNAFGSATARPAVAEQTEASPVARDRNYVFGGDRSRESVFSSKSEEHKYVFGDPLAASTGAPAQAEPRANAETFSQGGGVPPVNSGERPMVFVLRDDRNMFVYEYTDRLDYYRRTEYGMSYCATKFKNLSR